jgi:hypothetical protein
MQVRLFASFAYLTKPIPSRVQVCPCLIPTHSYLMIIGIISGATGAVILVTGFRKRT